MLNVVIGYDKHEAVAYHVLAHSIMRHASVPVCITPLYRPMLEKSGLYSRPLGETESTEFSLTRFLTPSLCAPNQTSIFMDCDMLVRCDIAELAALSIENPAYDVLVVQHDYVPKWATKFHGHEQTHYPCKNWSSMIVFNGWRSNVQRLGAGEVNDHYTAAELHRFKWAGNIGGLDLDWNHLVEEYDPNPRAKIVHWTNGGPWFKGYENVEFAEEWRREYTLMTGGQAFHT